MRVGQESVFHANSAVVKFGGVRVGRLHNLQATTDSGADYLYEVGDVNPVEINHNRNSYRLTASGFIPRNNQNLLPYPISLGQIDAFDVELIDRNTGTVLVAEGVEPTGDSSNVPTNQRITQNINLMALKFRQQNEQTLAAA